MEVDHFFEFAKANYYRGAWTLRQPWNPRHDDTEVAIYRKPTGRTWAAEIAPRREDSICQCPDCEIWFAKGEPHICLKGEEVPPPEVPALSVQPVSAGPDWSELFEPTLRRRKRAEPPRPPKEKKKVVDWDEDNSPLPREPRADEIELMQELYRRFYSRGNRVGYRKAVRKLLSK